MSVNNNRGKYRNVGFFRFGGEIIVGLKRRPDGRFYAADKPTKTFGKDPSLAVHRFRQWEAEQNSPEPYSSPVVNQSIIGLMAFDEARDYYRNLLLTDLNRAADELDIPELRFGFRQPIEPTMTLTELGEKYRAEKRNKRGKPLSDKHKKLSKMWWDEFVNFTNVQYASGITDQQINDYSAEMLRRFDDGMSSAYVKHRFGKVKAVLAFGIKKGMDSQELNRVLQICLRVLETPAPPPPDPKPIAPDDFTAMLAIANIRQKSILLTALNLCMKSGEVAALDKADCDLNRGTVVTQRSKTGVTRVGVLWQRTIDAIREYQEKHPHGGEHLFNSRIGTRLTAKSAGRIVIQLRRKAGLPESVNFDTIRDGGYTAAIEGGASEVHSKLLAGHKVKMSDQYVRRNPKMVSDACKAIEKHYFPPKRQRKR